MKIIVLAALFVAFSATAEESPTSVSEVTITPIPAPQHSLKQPWLDRAMLRARDNAQRLQAERGDRPQVRDHQVVLKWPVRKAISVAANEVEFLSQHVDQDTGGGILDWNCGTRTYDGHNGTDIGVGPYPWYQMRRDEGIAVAAAPGVIVEIVDNFPEESCDTNQKDGNVVVVQHDDGSYAAYAHIRTGSATHRSVGDPVYVGEYIGVIGSSGISSGPHLHFHVGFFETVNNVEQFVYQDPWDGACNNIGGTLWWEEPPPALIPFIMDVRTHGAAPVTPACPQSEEPNFKDSFQPGDPIVFSAAVHDWPQGETIDFIVRRPDNSTFVSTSSQPAAQDQLRATLLSVGTTLPDNAPAGEWNLEVSFNGETEMHEFWVNASPPAPPAVTVANNAFNGLYYDPDKSGEGYNFITSPNGTVIFFYGSDEDGNRVWLLSELVTGNFTLNQSRQIRMYESTGGVWSLPKASGRGLSVWGHLNLTFTSCTEGVAELQGVDGLKVSNITKLAGVPGSNCVTGAARSDNIRSGLWYDPVLTGEGFNVIVAPNGVIIFYYGFDENGDRLWMHSNVMTDIFDVGEEVSGTMFRASQGTFNAPVANVLQDWGTITVEVNSCTSLTITMDTVDGGKVSQAVRLAQVIGLGCPS